MDRLAQTALSAIRQMQDLKFDLAHNLANVNVPGFRRDLPNEGNAGFLETLDKASAKVLPLETDVRLFFLVKWGGLKTPVLRQMLLF